MKFDEIQSCIQYLQSKQVQINDSKLFDQFCNLKTYASELDEEEVSLDKQWVKFFKKCPNPELNSELLIMCHFYFAIPSHNANVERVFSLINSQWTKERNRLCLESVKGLIFVKFNSRHLSCEDFHKYIVSDKGSSLLKKSCCFRQISAWLNRHILPLRIQKDVCGTFNKFYLSKLNVVSLILVLHYTYMLKKKLFLKCPAFLLKVLLFLKKCPAFIIIHLVTLIGNELL